MKLIRLSIPTPFYVGDVNVYLIREDPVTLIDVGPKTPEAEEALRRGLAEHGLVFADIRRIVITHAHEDHCGLAMRVREHSGDAEILMHEWENSQLTGRVSPDSTRELLVRAGVPEDVYLEMRELYREVSLLSDPLTGEGIGALNDGDELEFDSAVLRVVHTPGHTPGSCSFFREADRTLICGDCILKRITPNPVLSPDPLDPSRRFPSLSEYLVSLARLRELRPTLVYGGHGEAIADLDEIFNRYVKAIDERQRKVIGLVPPGGITAFEMSRLLFRNASENRVQRFLAVSEAAAHLDHAGREGKLAVELKDGVEIYIDQHH